MLAILSDIHANLEAFEAVCADLRRRGVERVFCLGDNIGYGPDPEEVVRRMRDLGYHSVLGNHEMALLDPRARRWLNFLARENNLRTARLLSLENHAYSCTLPKALTVGIAYLVHGFPPQSVFRYLDRQDDSRVAALFAASSSRIFFVGHTHRLQLVHSRGEEIVRRGLGEERIELLPEEKYLISAGSVGQPRDGDRRAKYLLWDEDAGSIDVCAVAYDIASTQRKIRELGFPEIYASRLG